jgi:hypothetical protein
MIWPISRLCSAIAIPSNLAVLRLSLGSPARQINHLLRSITQLLVDQSVMLPQQGCPTGLRRGLTALEGESGIVITPGLPVINGHVEPVHVAGGYKTPRPACSKVPVVPVGLSFMIQPRFEVLTEPFPEVPVQLRAVPGWVPKLRRSGPVRMP